MGVISSVPGLDGGNVIWFLGRMTWICFGVFFLKRVVNDHGELPHPLRSTTI